ncbi:hypothetical protein BsIDN1_17210 [Bacillus safensis]|uniref:Uncharacterized protein n=1 Tax=Bacillus safensis TaxID=561879 RepID=A0A5S9M4P1_BACIA|nr:hypothetical protein BsIDN1_17210 [Bacillus safensis]
MLIIKKMFVHVDLIHGIKHDEYGTEFICQEMKPAGIISTRSSVIVKSQKKEGICHSANVFT